MIKVTIEIPGESYHFSGAPQEAIDAIRGMMGKEPEVPKEDPGVAALKDVLYEQYRKALSNQARYTGYTMSWNSSDGAVMPTANVR